jgi:hypothetical protein
VAIHPAKKRTRGALLDAMPDPSVFTVRPGAKTTPAAIRTAAVVAGFALQRALPLHDSRNIGSPMPLRAENPYKSVVGDRLSFLLLVMPPTAVLVPRFLHDASADHDGSE